MKIIQLDSLSVSPKLATKLLFSEKWARKDQLNKLKAICKTAKIYNVKGKPNLTWFVGETYAVLVNRSAKTFSDFKLASTLNKDILDGYTPVTLVEAIVPKEPTPDAPVEPTPEPVLDAPEVSPLQEILDQAEASYQADVERAKRRFEYNVAKELITLNIDHINEFHALAHAIVNGKNTVHNHAKIKPLIETMKIIRGVVNTIDNKLK